ncbi:hypothetical protein DSO57_1015307 [Entomophthora muscae]|uniref:Uncharacterized protein n=1 Tax=Entomophthora muscae TaxID=34485 RepID=A0ACC2TGL7_9FUNG|nr:hypothetical protein DSO57_1015307 [Entomophthora muscae]
MADFKPENCKAFMCMLHSSWVRFLNQTLPGGSCQLRLQDCNTTVAGLEHGTVTHSEEEEEEDPNSIFSETEVPVLRLPCLGFEDLQDWSNSIVLETASLSLATPLA